VFGDDPLPSYVNGCFAALKTTKLPLRHS